MSKRPVVGLVVPVQGHETNAARRQRKAESRVELEKLQEHIDRYQAARAAVVEAAMKCHNAKRNLALPCAAVIELEDALDNACAALAAVEKEQP